MFSGTGHHPMKDALLKMPLGKQSFLHKLVLENEAQINKLKQKLLLQCFSCQNKSACQKLAQSCKKMKIGPKSDIHMNQCQRKYHQINTNYSGNFLYC